MPIEYPVRDSFLMSCLSRIAQNFCATSSAVFPGLMAEMPSSKASLVALIASIFFALLYQATLSSLVEHDISYERQLVQQL